jgi:hypothetical protein
MKVYPLSEKCPQWALSYLMEQHFFDEIHQELGRRNINFFEGIKRKTDKVRLYVDVATDLGYSDKVKFNRGNLMFILEDTSELTLRALKGR